MSAAPSTTDINSLVAEVGKWAREAGEWKGRYEASENATVLELWRDRIDQIDAEKAEAIAAAVEAERNRCLKIVSDLVAEYEEYEERLAKRGDGSGVMECRSNKATMLNIFNQIRASG